MRVRGGRVERPHSYFRLEDEFRSASVEKMPEEEGRERLRSALVDSVRAHLVSDVPVGAFLSGGVDSSALVGLLSEVHEGPIRTVSLSFDVASLDESGLARQAAQLYGTEHHDIAIKVDEIRDRMPDAIRALDLPSVDGINTYFVSEAAVQAGLKVCVSGVGGDELFGGYGTFSSIPRWLAMHAALRRTPGIGSRLTADARLLRQPVLERHVAKLQRILGFGGDVAGAYFVERGLFSPGEIRGLLDPDVAAEVEVVDPREHLASRLEWNRLPEGEQVSALEIRQYLASQLLRDSDATSMRHSLELRTPLVDRDLLRAALSVPPDMRRAGPAKKQLRTAPRPPIPETLWNRPKQGFTLPFEDWLRRGALPLELPRGAFLRPTAMEKVRRGVVQGRLHWSRLWALHVLKPFID